MDILEILRIDFQELTADQFLAEMIKEDPLRPC